MSYLCKKAVKLFGKPYQPGDIIPTESVLSTRVRALITCGYIADAPAAEATEKPAGHNDEPKEKPRAWHPPIPPRPETRLLLLPSGIPRAVKAKPTIYPTRSALYGIQLRPCGCRRIRKGQDAV